jgi:hypothetical protein
MFLRVAMSFMVLRLLSLSNPASAELPATTQAASPIMLTLYVPPKPLAVGTDAPVIIELTNAGPNTLRMRFPLFAGSDDIPVQV